MGFLPCDIKNISHFGALHCNVVSASILSCISSKYKGYSNQTPSAYHLLYFFNIFSKFLINKYTKRGKKKINAPIRLFQIHFNTYTYTLMEVLTPLTSIMFCQTFYILLTGDNRLQLSY